MVLRSERLSWWSTPWIRLLHRLLRRYFLCGRRGWYPIVLAMRWGSWLVLRDLHTHSHEPGANILLPYNYVQHMCAERLIELYLAV